MRTTFLKTRTILNPAIAILGILLCGGNLLFAGSPQAAPAAPTNLRILERSFDFIYLVWDDNSDNEENFILERHTEGEEFVQYATIPANNAYFIDNYVEPNTKYYYRVYAINVDGSSDFSNEVDTSTYELPNRPPDRPDQLTAVFDDINRNILTWRDNSENELRFKIYRSLTQTDFVLLDSVIRDVSTYSDYAIESNRVYYYYVIAENNYGTSDPSDTARAIVTQVGPANGLELSLKAVTATEVTLSWNAVPGPETSFTLYRANAQDTISIVLPDSTQYTDTSLSSNTDYAYQLEVQDSYGNSSYSNIVEVRTLPWFTQYRSGDSLVLFYVFSQFRGDTIPDQSWAGEPSDLVLSDTSGAEFVDSSYLRLESPNILVSSEVSEITEACRQAGELSIECWIKTSVIPSENPANILSLEKEDAIAFSLSCIRDDKNAGMIKYFANLTTMTTDNKGNPDFESKATSHPGVLQHIVYTHDRLGEELFYINGQAVSVGYRPPGYDNWETGYSLLLGNKQDGNAAFLGNYYMCAIYNRALSDEEISQNYYASPFAEDSYILNSPDYRISAFPNPSSDEITVHFTNENANLEVTRTYTLLLVNPHGLVVRRKDVSDMLNTEAIRLDLSGLDSGIYSLILLNPYGIVDSGNIIITR